MSTLLSYGEYSDAFSVKLCKTYEFESDIRFNLKCMYMTKPEIMMFSMFVMTVMFFAYLIRIFEIPYYRAIENPVFD